MDKNKKRIHRKRRIKVKVFGNSRRPRLCVFRSLRGIYAQVIDDEKGRTLVSVNTKNVSVKNNVAGAGQVGKFLAQKCVEKKIKEVVFDRGGYKYHGKVKVLAESAKKGGLKF